MDHEPTPAVPDPRLIDPEANPALAALRALVEQIERSDFRDGLGHPLELNIAYIEARELVRGYAV